MELNLIPRIDRRKVGIATSVAKEYGFDWLKTIEWARSENLNHVQFYINPQTLKEDLVSYLKYAQGLNACFHLPAAAGEATIQYCLHTLQTFVTQNPIIIIQHQQWAPTVERFMPYFPEMILAIENDFPGSEPDAFRGILQEKLENSGVPFWAVLDIPRFYHQAPPELTFKQITSQIDGLFEFLQNHSLPFLIHAIDQTEEGGERTYWRPFLKGDLPWLHFIKTLRNSSDLLKCFVFEYENWSMAKDGIDQVTNG